MKLLALDVMEFGTEVLMFHGNLLLPASALKMEETSSSETYLHPRIIFNTVNMNGHNMSFVEVNLRNCLLKSIIPQLRSVVWALIYIVEVCRKGMQFSHRLVSLLLQILRSRVGLEPRQKFRQKNSVTQNQKIKYLYCNHSTVYILVY